MVPYTRCTSALHVADHTDAVACAPEIAETRPSNGTPLFPDEHTGEASQVRLEHHYYPQTRILFVREQPEPASRTAQPEGVSRVESIYVHLPLLPWQLDCMLSILLCFQAKQRHKNVLKDQAPASALHGTNGTRTMQVTSTAVSTTQILRHPGDSHSGHSHIQQSPDDKATMSDSTMDDASTPKAKKKVRLG